MSKAHFLEPEPGDMDEDGYMIGSDGKRYGHCSECGKEVTQEQVCPDGALEPID